MARALPALSAAVALAVVVGCSSDEPPAEALIAFAGPEAFVGFELRDGSDQVIWQLSAEPAVELPRLVYGEVPTGFRQQVPADGAAPRPLLDGEPLSVRSLTPRRVFHHEGYADGGRLAIFGYEMQLREDRPEPEGAPAEPPTPPAAPDDPARR